MATKNITISFKPAINGIIATPEEVVVGEGDELVITNTWFNLVKLILSSDAIGRLNPMPDAIIPINPNETITFLVENLANRAYEVKVRPTGFSNQPPDNENTAVLPQPVFRFFETRMPAGGGGGGGLEEFP